VKKNLLSAVVLGSLCGAVQAQTNVSIYGIADAALRYTNNMGGNSKYEETSATPGRIGFRGVEDLGGGMASVFQLENGFNIDTGSLGQNGRLFGRQAYVGIRGANLGTILMGRQYDSAVDYLQPVSAGGQTWAGGIGAHFGDVDNVNNSFRVNNAVKYTSPTKNSVTFGGLYGFGETAGNAAKNRVYSLGARYVEGPWYLATAYMNINSPVTAVYDGNANGAFAGGSPYTGLQQADKQEVFGVGGAYQVGAAKVGLLYTNTKYVNSVLAKGDAKYQNFEVNCQYNLTPALLLGGGYNYTHGRWTAGNAEPNYNQFNAGVVYSLSKSVALYLRSAYQRASGDARFAAISFLTSSSTNSQVTTEAALRYLF